MVPAKFGMWISVSDYAAAIARAEAAEARERDAWEAGRDAAADAVDKYADGYGRMMRETKDKKEKHDWQSMLMASVDIKHDIRALTPPDNIGGKDE